MPLRVKAKAPSKYTSYMFPKEAIAYYASYTPSFQIACILPPLERNIKVRFQDHDFVSLHCKSCEFYKSCEDYIDEKLGYSKQRTLAQIEEATQIYHRDYCPGATEVFECKQSINLDPIQALSINVDRQMWLHDLDNKTFKVHAIKESIDNVTKQPTFLTKPYRLANVYNSGDICWGHNSLQLHDLKQAVSTYWTSEFNKDLTKYISNIKYTLSSYNPEQDDIDWTDSTSTLFGNSCKYIVRSNKKCDGIAIFQAHPIIDELPEECVAYVNNRKVSMAWIKMTSANKWFFNFNGFIVLKAGALDGKTKLIPLGWEGDIT